MSKVTIFTPRKGTAPIPVTGHTAIFPVGDRLHRFVLQEDVNGKADTLTHYRSGMVVAHMAPVYRRYAMLKQVISARDAGLTALEGLVGSLGAEKVNAALDGAPTLNEERPVRAPEIVLTTKAEFLSRYERALRGDGMAPAALAKFMTEVRRTLCAPEEPVSWTPAGAVALEVWKALGGRSRPTLKALRALPDGDLP